MPPRPLRREEDLRSAVRCGGRIVLRRRFAFFAEISVVSIVSPSARFFRELYAASYGRGSGELKLAH